jgi:hypothetical protein
MATEEEYIPNDNLPTMINNRLSDTDGNRRDKPHIAIVTIKLDVRAINADGTLDHYVMGDQCLDKYGVSRKGQFVIKGHDEADCINNVMQTLERIKNGQT